MIEDYYAILEVPPHATLAEIKESYRYLCQAHHPDKFRNAAHQKRGEEALKKLNAAYHVLSDPVRRKAYDDLRPRGRTASSSSRPNQQEERPKSESSSQSRWERSEREEASDFEGGFDYDNPPPDSPPSTAGKKRYSEDRFCVYWAKESRFLVAGFLFGTLLMYLLANKHFVASACIAPFIIPVFFALGLKKSVRTAYLSALGVVSGGVGAFLLLVAYSYSKAGYPHIGLFPLIVAVLFLRGLNHALATAREASFR